MARTIPTYVPRDGTRLMLVADDLLATFGTRASDGRLLTFEWSDPVFVTASGEPVYEAVVTSTDDGMVVAPRSEAALALDALHQHDDDGRDHSTAAHTHGPNGEFIPRR